MERLCVIFSYFLGIGISNEVFRLVIKEVLIRKFFDSLDDVVIVFVCCMLIVKGGRGFFKV